MSTKAWISNMSMSKRSIGNMDMTKRSISKMKCRASSVFALRHVIHCFTAQQHAIATGKALKILKIEEGTSWKAHLAEETEGV
jgi:hypothetical protein